MKNNTIPILVESDVETSIKIDNIYYHLYLLSKSEILKGQLCYDTQERCFFRAMYNFRFNLSNTYRKVEYTTDTKYNLPLPDKNYLNEFLSKNNIQDDCIGLKIEYYIIKNVKYYE